MRIGFDVSQTGALRAGCGTVSYSLLQELADIDSSNQYLLYPTFGDQFWDEKWKGNTILPLRYNFERGLHHHNYNDWRRFWQNPPADLEYRLGAPDIIHSHNFYCPPPLRKARLVYTLHDIGFIDHPEWTTEQNRIGCFRGAFQASLYADLIVAVSGFTRQHYLSIFPHVDPDRVKVLPLASRFTDRDPVDCPPRLLPYQGQDFLLAVGTLEPRKNYTRLAEAYAQVLRNKPDAPPLLIAGGTGWMFEGFSKLLAELGIAEHVTMLGFSSDAELRWLMQNCTLFLYPSYWEGFGLPVIEAMSQGACVVTSRSSSLPEVAGDAATLVDPHDPADIAAAIERLLADPALRQDFAARAVHQAATFSWRRSAERLLEHYQDLTQRPKIARSKQVQQQPGLWQKLMRALRH